MGIIGYGFYANRGIDVEILPREVIDKEEKVEDVDGTPLG